jgi:2-pyrone-4,6-dicarboxylate lactonase
VETFHVNPHRPRRMPPPGSWDTHFHIFDNSDMHHADRSAAYSPVNAPMEALDSMHRAIGIDRAVLIQPTAVIPNYEHFIAQLESNPRLAGVAVIDDDTTDASLEALHHAGVRGVRFHFVSFLKKRPTLKTFNRAVARIAELGWHVLVHVEAADILELAPLLETLPIPVIVDHIAHVRISDGVEQPGFQALLALQRLEHCWVKVANSDRWSASGAPSYADAIPFGRTLIANGTDRLIWATDWPHVMYRDPRNPVDPPPDDGDLMDLLFSFTDNDDQIIQKILVSNPSALYGS